MFVCFSCEDYLSANQQTAAPPSQKRTTGFGPEASMSSKCSTSFSTQTIRPSGNKALVNSSSASVLTASLYILYLLCLRLTLHF